jgi:hypothetical protein
MAHKKKELMSKEKERKETAHHLVKHKEHEHKEKNKAVKKHSRGK